MATAIHTQKIPSSLTCNGINNKYVKPQSITGTNTDKMIANLLFLKLAIWVLNSSTVSSFLLQYKYG